MAKQYVQHISGQGEKWAVTEETGAQWGCPGDGGIWRHWLPKSEYVLCEPPVVWKDVTAECEIISNGSIMHNGRYTVAAEGYRRRKVPLEYPSGASFPWAIIIEQKVNE